MKNVYIEFNKSNVANKLIKNMFKVSEKGGKGYELSDRIYPWTYKYNLIYFIYIFL